MAKYVVAEDHQVQNRHWLAGDAVELNEAEHAEAVAQGCLFAGEASAAASKGKGKGKGE